MSQKKNCECRTPCAPCKCETNAVAKRAKSQSAAAPAVAKPAVNNPFAVSPAATKLAAASTAKPVAKNQFAASPDIQSLSLGLSEASNEYVPVPTPIHEIIQETADTKTIVFDVKPAFRPGQFYQLTVFGVGEAPISISGKPGERLQFTLKKLGRVTTLLHAAHEGDIVGLRGPYGNGYPDLPKKQEVWLVAGGIGLPPVAGFLKSELGKRPIKVFYGARTPQDLVFARDYPAWKQAGVGLSLIINAPAPGWTGPVGLITSIINGDAKKAALLMCGPPAMYAPVLKRFSELGGKPQNAYVSLERMMRCGIGMCGHCMIGGTYACTDGPVFRADQMPMD